jgi:DNA modification methylase
MEINKIYNEDCLDTMRRMSDNFIDLTVTSPPYDNLRTYNGYSFDFESIAKELYRVTKDGGVVVWIVGDATIKGSETGTSFKQALFFKECGFNLHDTMIWKKQTFTDTGSLRVRYGNVFEYMFILTKGKIKTFNPIKDRINKSTGRLKSGTVRQSDGSTKKISSIGKSINKLGQRFNVWDINAEMSSKNRFHPAQFSEQIANDHIISWSNEGDLVYDCFMGSGTTAKMAISNNRNWIGSEMSEEYCEIIKQRLNAQQKELF